jgi:hypothetical protein
VNLYPFESTVAVFDFMESDPQKRGSSSHP